MGIIFLIRYNNDRIYLKIWHTAKEGKTLRFGNSDMSGPSGFEPLFRVKNNDGFVFEFDS